MRVAPSRRRNPSEPQRGGDTLPSVLPAPARPGDPPGLFGAGVSGTLGTQPPNATGTDPALRLVGRRLSTAARTFSHPSTRRTVTIVGIVHVGEARYFRRLSLLLGSLAADGAEIHVEGINHRDDGTLSAWEQDCLAEASEWPDPEKSGAPVSLLPVVSQGALRLPESTRNIDLSHVQLLRRVGWDNYRRLLAIPRAEQSVPGLGPLSRAVIRFQLRHGRVFEKMESLRQANREVNRVVIGERNRVAYIGAINALKRSDVVLVWGSDHLPGLAALFGAAGYRPRGERWFEACTI